MHYYGERYKHLYLPGSGCITESIQQCTPRSDACSTTCHPLSIIKSPMPRWQNQPQAFAYACPQPAVSQASLLSCQPYAQKYIFLYHEPCETTRLLPCRKPDVKPSSAQTFQPCEADRPEKKRLAKSLPPCAPRCPEPGKLRFPPCGVRYSSSCKDECRWQKVAKSSSRRYGAGLRSPPGMTGGYSQPLRGVTECPPQQCATQPFLREYVKGFPLQKCMKGYPTQEYVTTYSSQPCVTKTPPPHAPECPPGQGIKERSSQQQAVKCSLTKEGVKHKSSSTQHLSKSKCLYPRAAQHSTQHRVVGAKRSGHSKKSRCASKWLW